MKKFLRHILFLPLILLSFLAFTQPTFTSVPADGATNVNQSADIVLTFNGPIRDSAPGNADLTDTSIDGHITLKLTNAAGANIPFDATIDVANTIVTINPTSDLPSEAVIYVAIADVEDDPGNTEIFPNPTTFTFTVQDYIVPTVTFTPLDGTINVAVNTNIVIDFDEGVRKLDDSAITPADIEGGLVELKLTNDAGASVPFTASFTGGNQITINPNSDLNTDQLYYVEMNPVEDDNNNAIIAQNITFTTVDTQPPVPTFSPTNAATGVVESSNITITFNEPIRNIDNSTITAGDLNTLVELKLTDNNGANVPFSASINGGNTIITIDPTSNLAGSTVYYVEINPVEDANNNATTASNITFTTGNTLPPDITFNPADGATGVPVASNLTITFSEPVRKIDDSAITPADLATLVELKLTNNAGAGVPFTASIDVTNTIITIDPDANLGSSTLYYLEINPVEDAGDNAISATSITFTSADIIPPTVTTFSPTNGATAVVESTNITLTFSEAIRRASDDADLDNSNVDGTITLKINDAAGADIPFDATINGGDDVITIDPTGNLPSGTVIYVAVTGVEDMGGNLLNPNPSFITFTTDDTIAPSISSTIPADNATGISVKLTTITITFDEDVVFVGDNLDDDNRIRIRDVTNGNFVETIELADVSVVGNVVTLITDFAFLANTNYAMRIGNSVFEDLVGNPFAGILTGDNTTWNFQTEQAPNIASLSNSTRCKADALTITGQRFTGTGGSGNTQPTVTIDGNVVPPDSIKAFSATSITLNVPPNATSGTIVVTNNDSDLTSNASSSLTVHPQIVGGLSISLNPVPAINQSTNVNLLGYGNNINYSLIFDVYNGVPDGAGSNLGTDDDDGGKVEVSTQTLNAIGTYYYLWQGARTGCTTRTVSTFTIDLSQVDVTVAATNENVCAGTSSILIASTSGGSGYYAFQWTGPNGFSSNSSSPTITPAHPAGTGWYKCVLTDNSQSNSDADSVYITTFPNPTATMVPGPNESSVRTNYTVEDTDYQLYGSPSGGVFTGAGIVLKNDGNYYFNPQNAGVGSWPIIYTYTDVNGCSDTDSKNFLVSNTNVTGVDLLYCRNKVSGTDVIPYPTDTNIEPIYSNASTANINSTYQLTRIRFYGYYFNGVTGYYYYDLPQNPAVVGTPIATNMPPGATYPLSITAVQTVTDIQAGVTLPVGTMTTIPKTYTLNLDAIRNFWGYGTYYLDVFGKNSSGTEVLVTYQWFRVVDNGPAPSILGIDAGASVCSDSAPIELSSSTVNYTVIDFDIFPGGFDAALSGSEDQFFDPADGSLTGVDERPMTIGMDYSDFNSCPNTVYSAFTWVKKPAAPTALNVEYCQFADPNTFVIKATPNGPSNNPYWYDLIPTNPAAVILDSINFELNLASEINGQTPLTQTYYVLQQYKGCSGDYTAADITIKPAPNATVIQPAVCENRDFILEGPTEPDTTPYQEYIWVFGDGQSDTLQNNNLVTYNYGPGTGNFQYNLQLTVTNSLNCTNQSKFNLTVGLNPNPDFSWKFICDGDLTEFTGVPSNIVNEYKWDFGDGTIISRDDQANPAPEGGIVIDPHHNFNLGPGTYDVLLTAFTALGCNDSITKQVSILPYLTYTSSNPYVMLDENGGDGYFTVEDINGNSTWEFATPTTNTIGKLAATSWVTNANDLYLQNEKSFLNSPCLNLFGVDRPVLSFDYVLHTQENLDGIVLQYSKDNGEIWFPLGTVNSGINWFNTSGFYVGQIGGSTYGWSGTPETVTDNIAKDTVLNGRRALDNLSGETEGSLSKAERAKVRFRFAFQTDNVSDTVRRLEGFGFTNFKIESRNRVLLVENFTNEGDQNGYAINKALFEDENKISLTEAVKVQYHVGYPAPDNNSKVNPADQSARAAYYGITLSNENIPRAYVDAFSNGDLPASADPANLAPWVINRLDRRSLVTSPVLLSIESQDTTGVGYLKAMVTMVALQDIPLSGKPILHMGVIEKRNPNTNDNSFVLRKFFQGANGIPLQQITTLSNIMQGDTVRYTDRVHLEMMEMNYDSLALIAFIQDEITRNVYQATIEIKPAFLPDRNLITDVENPEFSNKISMYPNPANNELNIILPSAVHKSTPLSLVDGYGHIVYENYFDVGQHRKTIATDRLASGVYILQIGTPSGDVVRKKAMIVH